jgi:hypothetical protein
MLWQKVESRKPIIKSQIKLVGICDVMHKVPAPSLPRKKKTKTEPACKLSDLLLQTNRNPRKRKSMQKPEIPSEERRPLTSIKSLPEDITKETETVVFCLAVKLQDDMLTNIRHRHWNVIRVL